MGILSNIASDDIHKLTQPAASSQLLASLKFTKAASDQGHKSASHPASHKAEE